ncbi:CCC motif membrane protein [Flavobacterium sp.]|uniref:CCC motif membrane protein n=1 Tax=Flavobacterium sp. TaxID=239 RepID=UPI0012010A0B|nr:CCC motif membrane protein [Flavobacterium sp.]RZJ72243.1 MAG: DUF4190 domain-containing protein [Flavobacterium sp.]
MDLLQEKQPRNLPNATAVLILGIVSIFGCCCYGILGVILAPIALVLAAKDMKLYRAEPEIYLNYSTLNAGRIIAYIGLAVSLITLIFYIYLLTTIGLDGMMQMNEEMMRQWQKG